MLVIGTQGWNYDAWAGPFFPKKTRPEDYLRLYSKLFDSVEVDSTFYAPPTEAAVTSWLKKTPAGFSYSLKLPRSMTHERRLVDCAEELSFFCHRARMLGNRLASVLVQLPPDFSPREYSALAGFLTLLPSDINFAVEFRDPRWFTDRTHGLLSEHGVALALVDGEWVPRETMVEFAARPTATFSYLRWLGSRAITDHSFVQIERREEFLIWKDAVDVLMARCDSAFAYFSNFFQGHAPASANTFKQLMGQTPGDPDSLVTQPSLF